MMISQNSQLRLGVFFNPTGHHVASWRHPSAQIDAGINLQHYIEITQTAERGKMDMIFFQDSVAVRRANIEAVSRVQNDIDDEKFLHELIYYILYMLSTFQSKNEDIYTKKWKKKLEDDLRNNVYYKNFIPEFFYTLFHKLKKIIDDKNEFMDFVEGKKSKLNLP